MIEPSWLYPLVISFVVACNMGICLIIGYEEGKRKTKLKAQIDKAVSTRNHVVPILSMNADGIWIALPQGYQAP